MSIFREHIADRIPNPIKAIIGPAYEAVRRMTTPELVDRRSNLAIGRFGEFEIAYRRHTADESVIRHSFDRDVFFRDVPEFVPEPGQVIVDIGAHIGTFALLAASKIGHGKVYAIEASEDSFNFLRLNVALNRFDNIDIRQLAITDRNGTCTLYHSPGNWGHSMVKKRSGGSEVVPAATLSAMFERNQIETCHFMKLNCEGAEFPILLSTPPAVLQRIRTMLILYHCDLWGRNSEKDLITHLEQSGFRCSVRHPSGSRGWIIATS
jgi:FkbM family methyltransferase